MYVPGPGTTTGAGAGIAVSMPRLERSSAEAGSAKSAAHTRPERTTVACFTPTHDPDCKSRPEPGYRPPVRRKRSIGVRRGEHVFMTSHCESGRAQERLSRRATTVPACDKVGSSPSLRVRRRPPADVVGCNGFRGRSVAPALNCAGRLQSIRAKTCSRDAKNFCHPPLAPW